MAIGKSELAKEYRAKFGSEMPTLKLARILFSENKLLFSNVEDARTSLRYLEGKRPNGQGIRTYPRLPDRPKNPYKLPESDEREFVPFKITGVKKLALLSDIHLPYHSMSALTACFDWLVPQKVDGLLLNGDTLDCFQLSKFGKDPRKRNFAQELEIFADFFKILKNTFPKAKLFFKMGNHEERYDRFLQMKAHEIIGVEEFNLTEVIKKRAPGITIIGDKRIIMANDLAIIHGHEFSSGFFSPVNVARGLYLRGKTKAIQGHNHQSSIHTEPNLLGSVTTTWSTGCLCELHPEYMPINKWNHGFALVELDSNGKNFNVQNKTIVKGVVY